MFDREKLKQVVEGYKADIAKQWEDERYKWEAVAHFQKYWNMKDPDFAGMFAQATAKTFTLLATMNYYPRAAIMAFAEIEPETVRGMFLHLFDETADLGERIVRFQAEAEELRLKGDVSKWHQHYQSGNAISTYLWLRYPDRYYIYKYTEVREAARELGCGFAPKKGGNADSLIGAQRMYDEIREELQKDEELCLMMKNLQQEADIVPVDETLHTLTADVAYYINHNYRKPAPAQADWWPTPEVYTPGLSAEDWLALLQDKEVFSDTALRIMRAMLANGGQGTCAELAKRYGGTHSKYNMNSQVLARKVLNKTGCPAPQTQGEWGNLWPVLYIGRDAEAGMAGGWIWRLRDELKAALGQIDLSGVPVGFADLTAKPPEGGEPDEEPVPLVPYTREDFLSQVFMTAERYDSMVSLLERKKNLILQGAPGVGKTYAAKRLAWSMMKEQDAERIEFVQFHQNYSYEDFIMGYRPDGEGFRLTEGIFYRFCKKAAACPEKSFFFIIDEINRGNMSKIFGELLMLIEKDYRGTCATLAYSGQPFAVPENLYIIGMMNTADRSLAMIDYALRRRFSFFEMEPGFDSEGFRRYQAGFGNDTFNSLIGAICELNREISQELGGGFRIGHSYFCGQKECTDAWMREVVYCDILPMLEEYWFDDQERVQKWRNKLSGVLYD